MSIWSPLLAGAAGFVAAWLMMKIPAPRRWVPTPCAHKFDSCNLHRYSDDVVAGMCWKCNKVFTADCGLHLPGTLQCAPHLECPTCKGVGKVHAPKSPLDAVAEPSSGDGCP